MTTLTPAHLHVPVRGKRRSSALSKAKKKAKKVVLIGSTKSGKTALVRRFVKEEFSESYEPTVEETYFHSYQYRNQHFFLEIIDLPSPFAFPVMRDLHVKVADAVVFIYDMSNERSLTEMKNVLKTLQELRENLPAVVVGTKRDLYKGKIDDKLANDKCYAEINESELCHVFTSAKYNTEVKKAFESCLDLMLPKSLVDDSQDSDSDSDDGSSRCASCFSCFCFWKDDDDEEEEEEEER